MLTKPYVSYMLYTYVRHVLSNAACQLTNYLYVLQVIDFSQADIHSMFRHAPVSGNRMLQTSLADKSLGKPAFVFSIVACLNIQIRKDDFTKMIADLNQLLSVWVFDITIPGHGGERRKPLGLII